MQQGRCQVTGNEVRTQENQSLRFQLSLWVLALGF